ncbi:hypothetical protein ACC716_18610 [Rhizobium johnstonii]|uniref:hypothetical protein n=1 Tax=Rhizobium TaxID=379 RepID=UPI0013EF23F6|nr:hypothetical protein [Rhizobium leguminosarum]
MRTRQAPDLQDAKLAAMQEVQRHVQTVLLAAAVTFELAEQASRERSARQKNIDVSMSLSVIDAG